MIVYTPLFLIWAIELFISWIVCLVGLVYIDDKLTFSKYSSVRDDIMLYLAIGIPVSTILLLFLSDVFVGILVGAMLGSIVFLSMLLTYGREYTLKVWRAEKRNKEYLQSAFYDFANQTINIRRDWEELDVKGELAAKLLKIVYKNQEQCLERIKQEQC